MDLASTLGDLANRFTNQQQVENLEKFIKDTTLAETVKTRLNSAVDRSKKNLEWDSKRLKEMRTYFDQGNGGTGNVRVLSFIASILAIAIFVLN